MKCYRRKALAVNVGKRAHCSAVPDAQQVSVVGMLPVMRKHRDRIEAGTVVMQLSLDAAKLAAVQKIPVATSIAVVAPMRQRRHIADYRIERYESLVVVAEVVAPGVDLFLSG